MREILPRTIIVRQIEPRIRKEAIESIGTPRGRRRTFPAASRLRRLFRRLQSS